MKNSFKFGKYKHFKGNYYEAISLSTHSETLETLVVYKALYGDEKIWVRPLSSFCEYVVLPSGEKVKRFLYIEK